MISFSLREGRMDVEEEEEGRGRTERARRLLGLCRVMDSDN